MPTVQQERGQRTIKGLPQRWGKRAYQQLTEARAGKVLGEMPARYSRLSAILDEVTNAPLPIDATDAQLVILAERSAGECASVAAMIHDPKALRARLAWMVTNRGLQPPQIENDRQFMLRCVDPAWWRRGLRRVHGRAFEHAAMRLGFVSIRNGAYASNETVARHAGAKRRNARTLASVTMTNELGHEYALAELALKSVANKSIRRAELMLRMRGCEEIANDLEHAGVFVTLTCPSKFHAVLAASGTTNPNYNDATAREAQAYLVNVWACIRSALHRYGIRPYGFRIAEPHHDGCPHWHMLLFVPKHKARRLQSIMRDYALAEDGEEPGAKRNRIKIVRIEAEKGTAAGYIAKYVGKNIDGEHVGDQLDNDGNVIPADLVGDEIVKPAQRVEAWASTWGIRQFQPIGQPPVTIWRELRRVGAEQVEHAPDHIREAWEACQRVEEVDEETGEVTATSTASFARYIRAQGGVNMGRRYAIAIAAPVAEREGRYGLTMRAMPAGVYCRTAPDIVYASTRYEWKRTTGAAAQAAPWTRVNNCTEHAAEKTPDWVLFAARPTPVEPHDDTEWYANFDFAYFGTDECRKHYLRE
ncbi:replication endonuclease [Duganella radicis]|uniref:Replication endonuclease n=1 Tax=Duganella radicis TaxID=551988 RepID=A0A6L6PBD1_9BURK|nr:replication endonuclease [Duganella radicis]MTV36270.1 replication endonuclease [Duganella radicis]